MKVEILRCFQTKFGVCGEYYVFREDGSKELVFQNCHDIKVIPHWLDHKVSDCITSPTQKVIDAIKKASSDYLEQLKG